MKELVRFSLTRRFLNKTNKIVLLVLFIIFMVIGFIDPIVKLFNPNFNEPLKIRINVKDNEILKESLIDEVIIDQKSEINIQEKNDKFTVQSIKPLHEVEKLMIETTLQNYQKMMTLIKHPQAQEYFDSVTNINIDFQSTETFSTESQDSLFFVITGIYFVMLGFAGMLAAEVVAEKTSNILEIIGTSISLKTHYYSKIIIGWCSILIQVVTGVILFILTVFFRFLYDGGKGLMEILFQVKVIPIQFADFNELFNYLLKHKDMLWNLSISIIFLFIGILFIQMILVLITTKVKSIEEAGALQNPFYIFLLILYYVTILLNNVESMSNGLGKILSFIPISSMLFMPARLMLVKPPTLEVVTSLVINIFSLIIFVKHGESIYQRNVLDNSNKTQKPTKK